MKLFAIFFGMLAALSTIVAVFMAFGNYDGAFTASLLFASSMFWCASGALFAIK